MRKAIAVSVIINIVLLPVAILYSKQKIEYIKNKNQDIKGWDYVLAHPNATSLSRTTLFDVLPTQSQDIVFFGHSQVANCEWSELFNNSKVLNRGISGETLDANIARADQVAKVKPSKLFIMAGTNDLGNNANIDSIAFKYQKLLNIFQNKSPKTKIYIISVLPRNDFAVADAQVIPLNSKIMQLAKNDHCTYINLYKYFATEKGLMNLAYTYDGMHLNGRGYLLIKNVTEKYVND